MTASVEKHSPEMSGLMAASSGFALVEAAFIPVSLRLRPAALWFIAVICLGALATTAGVMASFASLGDVIISEPKAMIGFAGPRVIKETTHQDLPKGFQTAEFLEEHGLIDMIVHRKKMRETISQLLGYFSSVS